MKSLICALFLLSAIQSIAHTDESYLYTRNGTKIFLRKVEPGGDFDPDLPRKLNNVNSDMILKNADTFLRAAFGKDFKLPVASIGLLRRRSTKGFSYYWEWSVAYLDPDQPGDARSARLILIPVAVDGRVLMAIESLPKKALDEKSAPTPAPAPPFPANPTPPPLPKPLAPNKQAFPRNT